MDKGARGLAILVPSMKDTSPHTSSIPRVKPAGQNQRDAREGRKGSSEFKLFLPAQPKRPGLETLSSADRASRRVRHIAPTEPPPHPDWITARRPRPLEHCCAQHRTSLGLHEVPEVCRCVGSRGRLNVLLHGSISILWTEQGYRQGSRAFSEFNQSMANDT